MGARRGEVPRCASEWHWASPSPLTLCEGGRFLAVLGMTWVREADMYVPFALDSDFRRNDDDVCRENDVRGGGAIMVHHSHVVAIVVRIGG